MFHLRLIMIALLSLRQNFLRSTLATLGVIIGVGAVVSAVSILEGAKQDVLERFESLGADQVMVFNGAQRHGGRAVNLQTLLPEDADLILEENPDRVVRVSPQWQGAAQIKYFENNAVAQLLGASDAYSPMNNYFVQDGRFITREDVRGMTMVCVLGFKLKGELFGALPAIGKTVKINGKSFVVVGVMEEKGVLGFSEVDRQAIIPLSTAMNRMFGQRYLTMMVVQCADTSMLESCIERVKKSLRVAHRIRAGEDDDFTIFTQENFKQQFGQVTQIFAIVLYSIAGISIAVGAIGIMNIMLVSVTERTREIGVRIAVGARRFDILRQFLAEASIISMFGGSLGIVCGWAICNFLEKYTEVLKTRTELTTVLFSLCMALLVGIASGIYPAIRAARLDPVQSLRYE
ncbi:MAG: ABC transporter permease [Phycisphaerae bacterium]|nr:ABC transporter permease [Phycisphaerae bacterium]